MPSLDLIRRSLAEYQPRLEAREQDDFEAAVAIIAYEPPGGSPELLLIQRATVAGDPWSGQMAFPGGRRDPGDAHIAETAAREALEEVGVSVGRPIGRLDDQEGSNAARPQRLVLSAFVYETVERPAIVANREVDSTVWIPVRAMLDPEHAVQYRFEREEYSGTFPGIAYGGYTVWGLTLRVLRHFFEVLGHTLPDP